MHTCGTTTPLLHIQFEYVAVYHNLSTKVALTYVKTKKKIVAFCL